MPSPAPAITALKGKEPLVAVGSKLNDLLQQEAIICEAVEAAQGSWCVIAKAVTLIIDLKLYIHAGHSSSRAYFENHSKPGIRMSGDYAVKLYNMYKKVGPISQLSFEKARLLYHAPNEVADELINRFGVASLMKMPQKKVNEEISKRVNTTKPKADKHQEEPDSSAEFHRSSETKLTEAMDAVKIMDASISEVTEIAGKVGGAELAHLVDQPVFERIEKLQKTILPPVNKCETAAKLLADVAALLQDKSRPSNKQLKNVLRPLVKECVKSIAVIEKHLR